MLKYIRLQSAGLELTINQYVSHRRHQGDTVKWISIHISHVLKMLSFCASAPASYTGLSLVFTARSVDTCLGALPPVVYLIHTPQSQCPDFHSCHAIGTALVRVISDTCWSIQQRLFCLSCGWYTCCCQSLPPFFSVHFSPLLRPILAWFPSASMIK